MARVVHSSAVVSSDAVLGEDVEIGPYAIIGPKVTIGDRTRIGSHSCIDGTTVIGTDCKIGRFACIGADPQDLKYKGEETFLVIGNANQFGDYTQVSRGTTKSHDRTTRIGNNNFIMAHTHVGHDCLIADYCVMANCVQLAGHVELEDHVHMGGLAGAHQFCVIGRYCMVGGVTHLGGHLPPFVRVAGVPGQVSGLNSVGLKRSTEFAPPDLLQLKNVYRMFFRSPESLEVAVEHIRREYPDSAHVQHFCAFIDRVRTGTAAGRPICRE